jgi:hypothetical protein
MPEYFVEIILLAATSTFLLQLSTGYQKFPAQAR